MHHRRRTELSDERRDLLRGGTAEVLARLASGDPLRLRELIAAALRARCQILDGDLAHLRALAVCADRAEEGLAAPSLDRWVRARVEEAIEGLLDDGGVSTVGVPREYGPAFSRFNRRPPDERRAFFSLLIDRRSIDELAREDRTSIVRCAQRARRAWLALTLDPTG